MSALIMQEFTGVILSRDEVKRGEVLADVISPDDGSVISQIHSPTEGTIFFACGQPLIMEGTLLYRIIRRLHQ